MKAAPLFRIDRKLLSEAQQKHSLEAEGGPLVPDVIKEGQISQRNEREVDGLIQANIFDNKSSHSRNGPKNRKVSIGSVKSNSSLNTKTPSRSRPREYVRNRSKNSIGYSEISNAYNIHFNPANESEEQHTSLRSPSLQNHGYNISIQEEIYDNEEIESDQKEKRGLNGSLSGDLSKDQLTTQQSRSPFSRETVRANGGSGTTANRTPNMAGQTRNKGSVIKGMANIGKEISKNHELKTDVKSKEFKERQARTGSVEKPRTAEVVMKPKNRMRGPMRNVQRKTMELSPLNGAEKVSQHGVQPAHSTKNSSAIPKRSIIQELQQESITNRAHQKNKSVTANYTAKKPKAPMPLPGSKQVFKNNHTFDQQATPRRLAVGAVGDNTDNNFEPKDLASYFKSINYNKDLRN